MGVVVGFAQPHARNSVSAKHKKSSAVTRPPVSTAMRSATSRDGQPASSQSCVILPLETPTDRAKSRRLMPLDLRYAASFMENAFSPSKILAQVKLLDQLGGQAEAINRKFGMAKGAAQKRKVLPAPPGERVLQKTFIREWRKSARMNQGELAEFLGVSTATVSQIENAETGYKQEYLEGIAEAVGCSPADLLVRAPDDPQPIWLLWDRADAAKRKQILNVVAALLNGP